MDLVSENVFSSEILLGSSADVLEVGLDGGRMKGIPPISESRPPMPSSCSSSSSVPTLGSVPPPSSGPPSGPRTEVNVEERLSVAAGSKLPSNSFWILF